MKRIIIVFFITLATININAGEKIRVTLNKMYSEDSAFVLPNKAISTKMPSLAVANEKYDFTQKLLSIAKDIAEEDFDNRVFTAELRYSGSGIYISINSRDLLDITNIKFYGDLIVDRSHFAIIENDDNKALLKQYFKKVKSKEVVFERTFEKVIDLIETQPSSYIATYNERQKKIELKEHIINGIDKLHAPKPQESSDSITSIDDIDAFKIDVELFDE